MKYRLELQRPVEGDSTFGSEPMKFIVTKGKEGWRVRQIGGYVYTVANIIPNLDRGMLTLQCVRVNE